MSDHFIIGDMEKPIISSKAEGIFNQCLAACLLILFSPLFFVLIVCHLLQKKKRILFSEERFGSYEIVDLRGNLKPKAFYLYSSKSTHPFLKKLPALFNILKGELRFVGNAPLTKEEVDSLKEEWECIRFQGPVGIFHLWEVESNSSLSWTEKIVSENYYTSKRSFWGDIKILGLSMLHLFRPRPNSKKAAKIKREPRHL